MEHRITSSQATSGDSASPTLREMFKAHISTSRFHSSTPTTTTTTTQQQPHQRQTPQPQPLPTPAQQYQHRLFGHLHQQAPPQTTEPFWHQCPYGTQHPLYYYPEFGYLHHPLYTVQTTDGETLKIGYESKFTAKRDGESSSRPRQSPGPKVDVYSGHEFVGSIPLKLLARFSGIPKRVFPRRQEATQAISSKATPTSSPKVTSNVDRADDANAAEDKAASGHTSSKSKPSREKSQAGDKAPRTAPVSLAYARPHMAKRTLQLKLDVVEMHSTEALDFTMKWMKDNESSDKELIDYAPPRLNEIKLIGLIDFYQAALAFELRPWGKIARLRREIVQRVSAAPLEISTFKRLAGWLPADDPVLIRCINSMEHFRGRRAYSAAEVEEVGAFLQQPGNEKLDAAFAVILEEWRVRREARQRERPVERRQREWERIGGTVNGGKTEASQEASSDATGADQNTKQADPKDGQPTPRGQNRRGQKAKDKAKQGEVG